MAGAAIPLVGLGRKGMWFDEAYTAALADQPFRTWAGLVAEDEPFFLLHELVVWVWARFGDSDAWLRLPSVGFAAATIGLVAYLGRRMLSAGAGITAALVLSLNAMFVSYGQEARGYSLAALAAAASSVAFVVATERDTRRGWVTYGVVAAIAVYAHLFVALVLLAHAVALAMRRPSLLLRHAAVAWSVTVVLVSPLAALLLTSTNPTERSFVPELSSDSLERFALELIGGEGIRNVRTLLLLCSVAVLVVGLAVSSRSGRPDERWAVAVVLTWLVVPVAVAAVVSVERPVLLERYLIVVLPALALAIGAALDRLGRVARAAVAVVLVALMVPSTVEYLGRSTKEGVEFPAAVAAVGGRAQPGDRVVFLSRYARYPFERYLDPAAARLLDPVFPGDPWGRQRPSLDVTESTASAARLLRVDPRRTWVVSMWGGFSSNHQDGRAVERSLSAGYEVVWARSFGPTLAVRLYEPDPQE